MIPSDREESPSSVKFGFFEKPDNQDRPERSDRPEASFWDRMSLITEVNRIDDLIKEVTDQAAEERAKADHLQDQLTHFQEIADHRAISITTSLKSILNVLEVQGLAISAISDTDPSTHAPPVLIPKKEDTTLSEKITDDPAELGSTDHKPQIAHSSRSAVAVTFTDPPTRESTDLKIRSTRSELANM